MPNGLDLILEDHRRVEDLFARFADGHDGDLVGQIVDALRAHDEAEHAALYPLAAHVLDDLVLVERLSVAHSAVKKQIDLITGLEGAPLVDAVTALQETVGEHVRDEEANLLPVLAERATPDQLEGLGARILQIKQRVG